MIVAPSLVPSPSPSSHRTGALTPHEKGALLHFVPTFRKRTAWVGLGSVYRFVGGLSTRCTLHLPGQGQSPHGLGTRRF